MYGGDIKLVILKLRCYIIDILNFLGKHSIVHIGKHTWSI